MNRNLQIAIDGPAASGKGTISRKLAKTLGLKYLDTGKIYRLVGVKYSEYCHSRESGNLLTELPEIPDQVGDDKLELINICNNINFDEFDNYDLSSEGVGAAASKISAIPEVRDALKEKQREFATNGAILDGRDIGTVILPEADFKFYITADVEIRAQRRFKQLQIDDSSVTLQAVLDKLKERDERDSNRKVAALKPAEDAIVIDTSELSIEEVYSTMLRIIKK